MSEAKFVVKGEEKVLLKYDDPDATLALRKATVAGNDGKPVTLKVEFEDYPEDGDVNDAEGIKPVLKVQELGKLTDKEIAISFVLEESQKPKLFIEGPGEVTVIGEFKGIPEDDDDDDEEEDLGEEGSESESE